MTIVNSEVFRLSAFETFTYYANKHITLQSEHYCITP